jgi:beta-phosphoglucomutase-like phosphatase (HAD superfamily)
VPPTPRPALGPDVDARSDAEAVLTAETLCVRWRAALDADARALKAARDLASGEIALRSAELEAERNATLRLLRALARDRGESDRFLHLTPARAVRGLLGLPKAVNAVVFNLEGVLVPSAELHAIAWTQVFDQLIWAHTERSGWAFVPFDPRTDYPRHLHDKPRLEGIRAFLASRGISLPEGRQTDGPGLETVHGLANQKSEAVGRLITQRGVTAYEGSRHYLQAAREASVPTAVVSASATTQTILEKAGLADLIDEVVDGNAIVTERLRTSPAPDVLLAAAHRLGVAPAHAAAFETSATGVVAARSGEFGFVVGVHRTERAAWAGHDAPDLTIPGLAELLLQHLPG